MTDELEGGCLEGIDRNHHEIPADGVEDAPSGGVGRTQGDNRRDQPEVERVADSRLGEGDDSGPNQDSEGSRSRSKVLLKLGIRMRVIITITSRLRTVQRPSIRESFTIRALSFLLSVHCF